jgi:hypothetical protein
VALSGISTSAQIARRLSPSAMRLQISSPSSVANNDGRPIGRFRGFMGLDQFVSGALLASYYARRAFGARVRPGSRSNRYSSHELRLACAPFARRGRGPDGPWTNRSASIEGTGVDRAERASAERSARLGCSRDRCAFQRQASRSRAQAVCPSRQNEQRLREGEDGARR